MKYVILASILAIPTISYADQNNVITFKGQVNDVTCTIKVNGAETTPVVLLPTAKTSDFVAAGSIAMPTNFELQLTDCGSAKSATAEFVGNNVTSNGNLGNTGSASNVSIQIVDNGTPLIFSGNQTIEAGKDTALQNGAGVIPFVAQYYAEAAVVTAGTVQATMQYAITYK